MEGSKVKTQSVSRFKRFNENVGRTRVDVGNWEKCRVLLGVLVTGREIARSVCVTVSMGSLHESDRCLRRDAVKSDVYRHGLGTVDTVVRKVVMPRSRFFCPLFFREGMVVEKLGGVAPHQLGGDRRRVGGKDKKQILRN